MTAETQTFVPLRRAAAAMGVPVAWLRREADQQRIPCLRVGRRRLFNVESVCAALDETAEQGRRDD